MTTDSTWRSLGSETADHLRRLIQFDTSNPPGNEKPVARYLDDTLSAAGIETQLFEPLPNRGSLVARLRGNGSAAPILVTAHMDVVGVERDAWTHDPFGGDTHDGYLYGRGAIDDKGMLAVLLVAMLRIQRQVIVSGGVLRRDIIFAATPDEEMAGDAGLAWLIAHHPELIRAEFALNEGGRIRVVGGRPLYAAVQTTEKVPHVVEVRVHGTGGHASVPLADNAVVRLARAVARIGAHQEDVHLVPTSREFFGQLGVIWPEPDIARAMLDAASDEAEVARSGCEVLSRTPTFDAILRTGISPTILAAGSRHNVIPSEAVATVSVRTLPGDSITGVLDRLRQAVDDAGVELALVSSGTDAPVSAHDSPMFAAIRESVSAIDPAIITVPYLSTGATESALLRQWGVATYGLLPFPLDANDEGRMHGNDERVPLAALEFGSRLVLDILMRMATQVRASGVSS